MCMRYRQSFEGNNINQYQMDIQEKENFSLPFISYSQAQGYRLHKEAASLINNLPENFPCSILSIVGKSKTGKSYLLNKLASKLKKNSNHQQEYFPVNDGISVGTKGVRIMALNIQGHNVILLDMEGLGNLTNNIDREGKLFALTLLLSSAMIYNNVGPLDLQGIQGLGILVQITKLLGTSLSDNRKRLQMPSLIVTLRDFALTLQNMSGKQITSNQYLEGALQEQRGTSASIANKNQIKKIIKDIFQKRDCLTFSLPSEEIPIHSESSVRPEFESQLKALGEKITKMMQNNPKNLNGKELRPSEWLSFAESIVQTVNIQEKQGKSIKLEGLLFQAYRRQQGTIRDRFFLIVQACIKKAEMKYHQSMCLNQIFSQIDEKEFIESAERVSTQLKKIERQLQTAYHVACREIEEMVKKQSGSFIDNSQIDYNHPSVAKIKDFSELYHIKQQKMKEISTMQENIFNITQEQLSKQKQTKFQKEQGDKFSKIMEEMSLCRSQKEADEKYLSFIGNLREEGTNLESKIFEANLLKLQVAYLRRKLECSEREKMSYYSVVNQKYPSNKKKEEEETPVLTEKNKNIFITSKKSQNISDFQSHNSKLFTFQSKDVTPFNRNGGTQPNKKSFLVPYITIPEDKINVEIMRTLVKQDNRGLHYFQYVLEMVLNEKRWIFNRRWKDFNQLHNILHQLFPQDMLPEFTPGKMTSNNQLMNRKEDIEIRRGQLEEYLRYLLQVGSIRNSRIMQKFLKVNKEYVPYL